MGGIGRYVCFGFTRLAVVGLILGMGFSDYKRLRVACMVMLFA